MTDTMTDTILFEPDPQLHKPMKEISQILKKYKLSQMQVVELANHLIANFVYCARKQISYDNDEITRKQN